MRILILLLCLCSTPAFAQGLADVDWANHSYPIRIKNGNLSDSGANWIHARSEQSQFVLFGEQHGVAGLPAIVAATYRLLFADGYEYLALEIGPWFGTQLSRVGVDLSLQAYPHSLAFDYDGEVAMLQSVESQFDGDGDAFWGLDQPIIAIHPYARLAEILPNRAARRAARGLYLKAALQAGQYLDHDNSNDFAVLRKLAGPEIDDEAALILDSLEISMQIYCAYHAKERNGATWVSDSVREQYMKDRFDAKLLEARQSGDSIPKAIIKMGGAHVMEGIGTNGVLTLGDHAEKIANSNDLEALHIGIRRFNSESPLPETIFARDGDIALVDAEGVRASLPESSTDESEQRLLRSLRQYDALIYLRDAPDDQRTVTPRYDAAFRRSLLTRVALLLLPLLMLASLVWPLMRQLWSVLAKRDPRHLSPFRPWAVVSVAGGLWSALVVWQLIQLRNSDRPDTNALASASWMTGAEVCLAATTIGLMVYAQRKGWWTLPQRRHFVVAAAGLLALLAFAHWWNLGRMLG